MYEKLASLWKKLANRRYRETFAVAHTSATIAAQIAQMREDRGWTQADLAEAADMMQSRVSVLENPNNRSVSLKTLQRLGAAFDVAVVVKFVPFSELARWSVTSIPRKYSVAPFPMDTVEWQPLSFRYSADKGKSFAVAMTSPVSSNTVKVTGGSSGQSCTVVSEAVH